MLFRVSVSGANLQQVTKTKSAEVMIMFVFFPQYFLLLAKSCDYHQTQNHQSTTHIHTPFTNTEATRESLAKQMFVGAAGETLCRLREDLPSPQRKTGPENDPGTFLS